MNGGLPRNYQSEPTGAPVKRLARARCARVPPAACQVRWPETIMKPHAAPIVLVALSALLIGGLVRATPPQEFEVGQIWAMRGVAKYSGAEVLVVKIDSDPVLGQIIFVDVENLRGKDGKLATLSFVPVSQWALRQSVDHYVRRLSFDPGYLDSDYSQWRSRLVNGKRLVLTGPLGDFLDKVWP